MTVPSLSASFQHKTKEAMDHASQSALDQKLAHTTPTQKFPKFLCHSLTTYRNFYSPPSPLKLSPLALIQRFQWDSHDRKHSWKSYCISAFMSSSRSAYGFDLFNTVKMSPLELQFVRRWSSRIASHTFATFSVVVTVERHPKRSSSLTDIHLFLKCLTHS